MLVFIAEVGGDDQPAGVGNTLGAAVRRADRDFPDAGS